MAAGDREALTGSDGVGDLVPRPDPTALTTAAVKEATLIWKDLQERDLKVIDTRLNALDQATKLAASDICKQREQLRDEFSNQLGALDRIFLEKLAGIDRQLAAIYTRAAELAAKDQSALDAAFAAAKETNTKSEDSFKEQLGAVQRLMEKGFESQNDKIDDLKTRMDRGEGAVVAAVTTKAEGREVKQDARGLVGLVLGTLVGVVGVIVAIAVALSG